MRLPFGTRRVATQDAPEAQTACHPFHGSAHMACAHDAQRQTVEHRLVWFASCLFSSRELFSIPATVCAEQQQGTFHILRHASGIASRAVGPVYALCRQIVRVQVVEAYRCCGYKPNARTLQKFAVAVGACAHNQRVDPVYIIGSDGCAVPVCHGAQLFSEAAHIRYFGVNQQVHVKEFIVESL